MSKEVVEIAAKHLGTISAYSENYDAELLLKIPRNLNREAYDIDEDNLPFVGYDVWNAFEVSAITEKGRPVTGMMKISYPCDSKYHVESKSIKLYLNSFNMTKLGTTEEECVQSIEETVSHDLSTLLECEVKCQLHRTVNYEAFSENNHIPFQGFINIENLVDLDEVEFDTYKSDASQLEVVDSKEGEICEMVFKHIHDAVKPDGLMVSCLYTRRGGLDINPVRATHNHLFETEFVSPEFINEKTLRQ